MATDFGIIKLKGDYTYNPPDALVTDFHTFKKDEDDTLISVMRIMPAVAARAPIETLITTKEKSEAQSKFLIAKKGDIYTSIPQNTLVICPIPPTASMMILNYTNITDNIVPLEGDTRLFKLGSKQANITFVNRTHAKFNQFVTGIVSESNHTVVLHGRLAEEVAINITNGTNSPERIMLPAGYDMMIPLLNGDILYDKNGKPNNGDFPSTGFTEIARPPSPPPPPPPFDYFRGGPPPPGAGGTGLVVPGAGEQPPLPGPPGAGEQPPPRLPPRPSGPRPPPGGTALVVPPRPLGPRPGAGEQPPPEVKENGAEGTDGPALGAVVLPQPQPREAAELRAAAALQRAQLPSATPPAPPPAGAQPPALLPLTAPPPAGAQPPALLPLTAPPTANEEVKVSEEDQAYLDSLPAQPERVSLQFLEQLDSQPLSQLRARYVRNVNNLEDLPLPSGTERRSSLEGSPLTENGRPRGQTDITALTYDDDGISIANSGASSLTDDGTSTKVVFATPSPLRTAPNEDMKQYIEIVE